MFKAIVIKCSEPSQSLDLKLFNRSFNFDLRNTARIPIVL